MTPIYKGLGQPTVNSGWLSGISQWFGGAAQPAYATKPVAKPVTTTGAQSTDQAPVAELVPSIDGCPIEPERITVLIPRELLGPQQ